MRPDTSWQARAGQGYAVSAFAVDWEAKTVTCPQGHRSVDWVISHDPWGTGTVHVGFEGHLPGLPKPPSVHPRQGGGACADTSA